MNRGSVHNGQQPSTHLVTREELACIDSAAPSSSRSRISSTRIPTRSRVPEAKRRVLQSLRGDDRAAGPRPALLREAQPEPVPGDPAPVLDLEPGARATVDRPPHHAAPSTTSWRSSSAPARAWPCCKATTRKGKPCQRTPLPDREYCPSHQHLEERKPGRGVGVAATARSSAASAARGARNLIRPRRPGAARPAAAPARGRAGGTPAGRSVSASVDADRQRVRAGDDREVG